MEEVVIVLADLYLTSAAEAASIRRVDLRGLGHIARYGTAQPLTQGWRPWLAAWAGRAALAGEPPASIASAASRSMASLDETPMVWLATPVHFVAGLSSVHLDPRGLLQVEPSVRQMLAAEFNTTFAGSGFQLEALGSAGFLLRGPTIAAVTTVDPARVLGGSITEALPTAADAPRLRRLSAEIEMWLHDHPVNQERMQRGRLPISALWFWGGGIARDSVTARLEAETQATTQLADTVPISAVRGAALLAATAHAPPGAAFGRDPYLHGLWRSTGSTAHPLPADFDEVLGHTDRRAVFVVELSEAFDAHRDWTIRDALVDADQRWIVRALAALRRGDVGRVTVVANDHKLSLGPRDRLKLWRMPRPALTALQ
ncbi:MAG TPA: hypothetical protein VFS52_04160 [Steroidobacteraceae bacterium]|nr:hypothetical protein [Steroidobacteraceae bacterium]